MEELYVFREDYYGGRNSKYPLVFTQFIVQPGINRLSASKTLNEKVMVEQVRILKKRGANLVSKLPPYVKKIEKLEISLIVKPGTIPAEIVVREGYDFSHINRKK